MLCPQFWATGNHRAYRRAVYLQLAVSWYEAAVNQLSICTVGLTAHHNSLFYTFVRCGELLNIKCVPISSTNSVRKISHSKKISAWCSHKCAHVFT
jgi:hypothetical protein